MGVADAVRQDQIGNFRADPFGWLAGSRQRFGQTPDDLPRHGRPHRPLPNVPNVIQGFVEDAVSQCAE
jgi:hypothetical protein